MSPDWKNKRVRWAVMLGGVVVLTGGGFYGYHALRMPRASAAIATHANAATYYTCPMHPNVHEKHPGHCPICGMRLVEKTIAKAPSATTSMAGMPGMGQSAGRVASSAESEPALPAGLSEVVLSPEQQVLANVATQPVAHHSLESVVTAAGQVSYDETRLSHVSAWIDGRIDRLYVNSAGATIRKGQALGTIYSPDVVSTMHEYLIARDAYQRERGSAIADVVEGARSLVDASRERLRLWGVTPEQIAHVERTHSPELSLALIAPASGTVIKKLVEPGQYVKTGDPLYDIADLSKVWVEANVYEPQMGRLRMGQQVEVTSPSYPGTSFVGRVSFIYPYLDPQTRTVRVRTELGNPQGRLKPDMYVMASIHVPSGSRAPLAVPASAVIDTGRRTIVYVEVSQGVFRPREVELGVRSGGYYPIVSGLGPGDRVATSGGFLLDADSQIRAGAESPSMAGMAMPKPSQPSQNPPQGDRHAMPGMKM